MEQGTKSPVGLFVIICLAISIYSIYQCATLTKEVEALKETISTILDRDDSAQQIPEETPQEKVREKSQEKPQEKKVAVEKPKVVKSAKIVPSAKVRVENRYVNGRTELPQGKFTHEGTVAVSVFVDFMGKVTKTEIKNSTINDEDLEYACREAALRTRFSSDVHAHDLIRGTITYTFAKQ